MQQVCTFRNEAKSGYYDVALDTLASKQPTLAVLAFLARIPVSNINATTKDSAAVYCTQQLGGSSSSSLPSSYLLIPTANVGWWTIRHGQWSGPHDLCMFADGSSIGAWTVYQHAIKEGLAGGIKFAYAPRGDEPGLLGGGWDWASDDECNPRCITSAGSRCVYISGGLTKTPLCTCSKLDDCPNSNALSSTDTKILNGSSHGLELIFNAPPPSPVHYKHCSSYRPTAPKNYKGNVCNNQNLQ